MCCIPVRDLRNFADLASAVSSLTAQSQSVWIHRKLHTTFDGQERRSLTNAGTCAQFPACAQRMSMTICQCHSMSEKKGFNVQEPANHVHIKVFLSIHCCIPLHTQLCRLRASEQYSLHEPTSSRIPKGHRC